MTDPNDVSTFIQLDSIMCSKTMSWEDIIVTFNNYSGDGQYIAFKTGPGANSQFYIDNVIIESSSNCVTPSKIYINNITDYSFEAQWDNHSSSSNWRVKVLQVDIQSDLMSDSCILDTVISNNSIIIDKLQIATSYSIIVQNQCSPNEISEWSNSVNVTTLCGSMIMPYFQDFEVFMPQCWSRYNGLLSTVVNAGGLVANSTAWSGVTNSDGLDGTHVRAGVWGANTNSWLVSPSINIDQSATLSFDIALYSTSSSVVYDKSDDRFIVIISTDNGLTWDVNNMTEWNNVGTGSYVMANISNSWKNYKINLSQYIGQNVKVAFYVESTIASGVDYLHLDNVLIDYVESTLLFDTVCQGYGYVDNQFNISPSEIQTAGKYVFNRTMLNSEQLDSIILLELTVIPTAYTFIDDTICHNNVYNGYGFLNINTTGVYTQTYYTVHGCDSIVSLNLKVRDEIHEINTHQICEKDIPYIWRTMELRESGVYSDTLLSVHDCDSIISLSLEIVPEYEHFDTVSVSFNELPFVYNDTIFDETTSIGDNNFIFHYLSNEGCDSIIHLQLTMLPIVRDNELYMNYIELYPNPISKDGILNVNANFSITELYEGLLLEVFNSVGERIKYQYIFNLPVQIKDFETSGLYIVRIKSKTNKSVYGKIIVQ